MLIPLLVLFLASCDDGNGGGGGRSFGGGGGGGTVGSGSFLLVADRANNRLLVQAINSGGALTNLNGPSTGGQPSAALVLGTGRQVYVANNSTASISAYSIATDGTMATIGTNPFSTGAGPTALAATANGGFLVSANELTNNVNLFAIDLSGNLTALSPVPTGAGPRGVSFVGNILYVATASDIEAFQLNPTSGILSPLAVTPVSGTGFRALLSIGNFLYATDSATNSVLVFPIDTSTGQLGTSVSFATGSEPFALVTAGGGSFLYVVNRSGNSISAFSVNASTGALTSLGAAISSGGTHPVSAAFDPLNGLLFVANQDSSSVSTFTVNSTTGALTAGSVTTFNGSQPAAVAVAKP